MARGAENKEVVERYFRELNNNLDFLLRFIPCIIPQNEDHAKKLEEGLKTFQMIRKFNEECHGDMALLDEIYDVDAIVEKYPDIEELLKRRGSDTDIESVLNSYGE